MASSMRAPSTKNAFAFMGHNATCSAETSHNIVRIYVLVGQTLGRREWRIHDPLSAISATSPGVKLYFHSQTRAASFSLDNGELTGAV
jgi:hypothetical protein